MSAICSAIFGETRDKEGEEDLPEAETPDAEILWAPLSRSIAIIFLAKTQMKQFSRSDERVGGKDEVVSDLEHTLLEGNSLF
jgi:hypothetical protein